MLKKMVVMAAATAFLYSATLAGASERATKKEAEAMVKKAVAAYKANGEKSFAEFTAPSKTFVSKDLYIVVYDMHGKCVAHGQNAKQVGKELMGMKDPDGKAFVKERVDLATSKGKFWQDYKFTDPLTKKVLAKQMYCEKVDEKAIICGGVYKD
ncbi:MAG: cache domain-containing protein [Desulfuromonadaceae bacterium]|nr:cache domain-containing protein [Desulfuromonadaceae bacterium]MDD5107739.1 cache domain-containing protein [Desulfuromonadaceae bacterium]